MDSFWSIHNFTPKIPLKENEVFGYKTEATPYAIDPMMTYLIAYHYGIPMNRDTQLESIQREIINYSVQLTPLRINIITKLTRMSRRGLIDIKNKFLPESPTDTSNNFPCILYPLTNSEAIERCAKDYRWDISLSRDPISEYIELDRVANDKYCPIDDEWRKVFDVNRQYFHLDFRYIKKFDHLYTENIKKGLIYRNGGSEKSDYLTFGIHPLYPGSTTIDTLRTCINNDPVSYDSIDRYRNLISSPDFIISREELFDLWKFNDCFVAPNDPSKELSDYHLKMILISCESSDPLRLLIENIKIKRRSDIDKSLYLCLENEEFAIEMLNKILLLGLYIRGYETVYTEYPLSESTYNIDEYQHLIEEKTCILANEILSNYSDALEKLTVITGRNIIGEDLSGYVLKTYGQGKNLKHIFDYIFETDKDHSCIRTNSNYFLATSWFFLNKIQNNPPFSLENLRFLQ